MISQEKLDLIAEFDIDLQVYNEDQIEAIAELCAEAKGTAWHPLKRYGSVYVIGYLEGLGLGGEDLPF